MSELYTYTDRDGDELAVDTVDYDGTPHAAVTVLGPTGRIAGTVHISPQRAWEVCEAILTAAGVNADD